MAKSSCSTRILNLIKKSSLKSIDKDDAIDKINIAVLEAKKTNLDQVDIDRISKEVTEQVKAQKKINKINAVNDEILVRKKVQELLDTFDGDEQEGLIALLVGSNRLTMGARSSVGVAQNAAQGQLVAAFDAEVTANNLDGMFDKADGKLQEELAITQQQISEGMEVTTKNQDIKKLAEIMEKHSELTRQALNARGANIPKMWGYVVRQSHDQFNVRAAANRLGKNIEEIVADPNLKGTDINYNKNFTAWKNFIMQYLDGDRTFGNTDNIDSFLMNSYNSLVGNKIQVADGASGVFGSNSVTKGISNKRVLHFKSAKDWYAYNEKFGTGSLKETYYSGLMTAGRNIGMLDTLGTKPKENFEKIRVAISNRMLANKRSTESLSSYRQFEKFMNVVDGTVYTFDGGKFGFAVAKWSAIGRAVGNVAKLGGAVISAAADIGIYASEMKYQGRSFLGGISEAMGGIGKIKNTKQKRDIAKGLGFLGDGTTYDISGRFQVGDNLNKGWTKIQRTFFKYNLLSWWTNTLKENSMLGMANYYANQKNLSFNQLNKPLQSFFGLYNIDATKWDIIRKTAMSKADDGTEFINISELSNMSDADIKKITGMNDLSKTELQMEKDKFKYSVSGMLLDRSIYAVIEPDARTKGTMTQGTLAGTGMGEAIRFVGQFKAFPMAIGNKVLGREIAFLRKGPNQDIGRGIKGLASIVVVSGFMGYMSMTAKDLLKGKEPRDPNNFKTIMAAFLQGGGLGIYGDVLFKEQRDAGSVAAGLIGPFPTTVIDLGLALKYAVTGEGGKAGRAAYRTISSNIPFLNLFYIKAAFDYMIGFQIMETMNPGVLKRVEKRMKKDYNQEYLFTKPSKKNKGF
ncbi:MAG: hypothetical protein CBC83_05130 [Flavobacteriales bacterium TMED123]|jgi:hypothetical protein|nr:MAG: hypothetical protein CBC83_05130 [Flavobacteriales bacterium TMED123]